MEHRKIVGVEDMSFVGKDGTPISGTTVHTTERLAPSKGKGDRADHFFLSTAKLSELGFTPTPGQTVEVFYNRFGKVATLKLVADDSDIVDIG